NNHALLSSQETTANRLQTHTGSSPDAAHHPHPSQQFQPVIHRSKIADRELSVEFRPFIWSFFELLFQSTSFFECFRPSLV
ncbi:hypothetical protein, partial [Thermobifida fusca]|uniref:hypothetical protein n=1 Tax=Thermobifida fusca TaxID=2021 RepID=UPI00241C42BB